MKISDKVKEYRRAGGTAVLHFHSRHCQAPWRNREEPETSLDPELKSVT
jgi:hypothetical protein